MITTRIVQNRIIIVLIALFCCFNIIAGEQYPVDTVGGRLVYRYPVKQAEGLWRISKNFNVTQDEILALNPELQTTGLRFGQVILIPVPQDQQQNTEENVADGQADAEQDYIVHDVVKGETLYSLSKSYGVTVEAIEELNPKVKRRGLKADQQIKIPRVVEKVKSPDLQKRELAADTTATQSVPAVTAPLAESQLQNADSSQLKAYTRGQVDKAKQMVLEIKQSDVQSDLDARQPAFRPESVALEEDSGMLAIPMRIALLLPFCTETVKRDANLNRFMEFYQGVLLALKQLQDEGMRFDLYVYDTDKIDTRMPGILARPEMRNIDAIIGPAYPSQVDMAAEFAKENKIAMIVPFTSKVKDIDNNPYILQFNPTDDLVNLAISDYLAERELTTKSILVSTPFADADNNLTELEDILKSRNLPFVHIQSSVIDRDSLASCLSSDRENIIFFDTDKQPAATTYIRRIETLLDDYKISVFGKQSWNTKTFRVPVICSSVFSSEESKEQYDGLYFNYFRSLPSQSVPRYDLLGYDITQYLVQILRQGSEVPLHKRTSLTTWYGLQSTIHCVPLSAGSGSINREITVK